MLRSKDCMDLSPGLSVYWASLTDTRHLSLSDRLKSSKQLLQNTVKLSQHIPTFVWAVKRLQLCHDLDQSSADRWCCVSLFQGHMNRHDSEGTLMKRRTNQVRRPDKRKCWWMRLHYQSSGDQSRAVWWQLTGRDLITGCKIVLMGPSARRSQQPSLYHQTVTCRPIQCSAPLFTKSKT